MLSSNQSSWHPGDGIDDSAEASAAASGLPENVGSRLFTPLYDSERHSARSVDVESGKISAQELGAKSLERSEDAIDSDLTALPHTMVAMAINDQVDVEHHDTNSSPASQHSANGAHSAKMDASHNQLHEVASLLSRAVTLLSTMGDSHHPHACPCHESTPSSDLLATNRPTAFTTPNNTGSALCNEAPANVADVLPAAKLEEPDPSGGKETHKPDPAQQPASTAQPVSLGQPAGWAAVEKALTDFDRQEIGGYKEDIDSLLTFTGLYSAVLTAFVIVSYPQLQEDTAGATLQVPRLIANQTATYTVIRQLVNSTAVAVTTTPPFQPSSAAIRINILWFTSLVISLATASFAILVKQWLRAYLAFASASPQGQLRIRHFRRAGLEAWKVFGIASLLPLFLQISLALFFVGLCVFTLDVHPSIGNATLPLVCAWAFLFVAVTVSPAFTSRCPYTTPALEGITHVFRVRINPFLLAVLMRHIPYTVTRALQAMFYALDNINNNMLIFEVYMFFKRSAQRFSEYSPPMLLEETDVMKDAQRDLEILAAADMLQADDRLLGTTIRGALEQSDADWIQILDFVMRVISNRVPVADAGTDPGRIFNSYYSLPPIVKDVIFQIFRFHVAPKAVEEIDTPVRARLPPDWQNTVQWVLCILADLNDPSMPLLSLHLDTAVYDSWLLAFLAGHLRVDLIRDRYANLDLSGTELVLFIACVRILTFDWTKDDNSAWRKLSYLKAVVVRCCQTGFKPKGLRLQVIGEAASALTAHLDSTCDLVRVRVEPRNPSDLAGMLDLTEAAIELCRVSECGMLDSDRVSEAGSVTPLRSTFRYLLRWNALQGLPNRKLDALRLFCALDITTILQVLDDIYNTEGDTSGRMELLNVIHAIAESSAIGSRPLNQIEILKLSVVALRHMRQDEAAQADSVSTTTAAIRWIHTFNLLSDRYFSIYITENSHQTVDTLQESWRIALYAWGEIPLTAYFAGGLAQAAGLPPKPLIPEYFYLMLWVAAGCGRKLSMFPELVHIDSMTRVDRGLIYKHGKQIVQDYFEWRGPRPWGGLPEYERVEALTRWQNGYTFKYAFFDDTGSPIKDWRAAFRNLRVHQRTVQSTTDNAEDSDSKISSICQWTPSAWLPFEHKVHLESDEEENSGFILCDRHNIGQQSLFHKSRLSWVSALAVEPHAMYGGSNGSSVRVISAQSEELEFQPTDWSSSKEDYATTKSQSQIHDDAVGSDTSSSPGLNLTEYWEREADITRSNRRGDIHIRGLTAHAPIGTEFGHRTEPGTTAQHINGSQDVERSLVPRELSHDDISSELVSLESSPTAQASSGSSAQLGEVEETGTKSHLRSSNSGHHITNDHHGKCTSDGRQESYPLRDSEINPEAQLSHLNAQSSGKEF